MSTCKMLNIKLRLEAIGQVEKRKPKSFCQSGGFLPALRTEVNFHHIMLHCKKKYFCNICSFFFHFFANAKRPVLRNFEERLSKWNSINDTASFDAQAVLAQHFLGKRNDEGERLARTCACLNPKSESVQNK